jgi:hypothetical protein
MHRTPVPGTPKSPPTQCRNTDHRRRASLTVEVKVLIILNGPMEFSQPYHRSDARNAPTETFTASDTGQEFSDMYHRITLRFSLRPGSLNHAPVPVGCRRQTLSASRSRRHATAVSCAACSPDKPRAGLLPNAPDSQNKCWHEESLFTCVPLFVAARVAGRRGRHAGVMRHPGRGIACPQGHLLGARGRH